MSGAVLLSAAVLTYPASIDFGGVEVGSAALRTVSVPAQSIVVSGVGFSATRTRHGVLVVYEPYEPGEAGRGVLTVRTGSGVVRIALRGRGIDTIPPVLSVPPLLPAVAGRPLTIHFSAADNDLVEECRLKAAGQVIARLPWPVTSFLWHVPAALHGSVRITIEAVDRTGNVASVTRALIVQPKP